MFEKIANLYNALYDCMPGFFAALLTIIAVLLSVALGLGIALGVYAFFGWLLMFVWGAIAAAFGLPTFGFWVYVGIVVLITFLRGGLRLSANKAS